MAIGNFINPAGIFNGNSGPSRAVIALMAGIFALTAAFPSDMDFYSQLPANHNPAVSFIDHYGRHINTAAMAILPIAFGDKIGFAQAVCVAVATPVATHSLKFLLNDVRVGGARLGERPYGRDSKSNMPSGHSSLAASAMIFVSRRYGRKHLWYLLPVTAMTMAARILVKAHTLSAVIAGCVLGMLIASLFTSARQAETKTEPASERPKKA